MTRLRTLASLLALPLTLSLIGCGEAPSKGAERAKIREVVVAASAPTELISSVTLDPTRIERVGNAEGTAWSPSDEELAALVTARRVILMGAEFEPWAQRAGLPPSRTLELSEGLDPALLISTATTTHTHGNGAAHTHGGLVPTTWSDPALLRAMVHGAGEQLAGVLPVEDSAAAAEASVARRMALEEQLKDYESALQELETAVAGRQLFAVAHGLEYVARAADAPLLVTLLEVGPNGERNDHAAALLEEAAAKPGHASVLVWLGPIDPGFAKIAKEGLNLTSIQFDLGQGGSGDTLLPRLAASCRALASMVANH